jgi:ATP-binding cassette subfamily C (CFTR/MRP) protein 1
MSVVPQFGFLFNGTLKENLDPNNEHTKEEIEQLFSKTGFKIRGISEESKNNDEDAVNSDFLIAKGGGNLSSGEKQVINFLRIILHNK